MSSSNKQKSYKPDWAPKNAGSEFAVKIIKGVDNGKMKPDEKKFSKRRKLDLKDYVNGVLKNDRTILARTITLIESNSAIHNETAQKVLKELLPSTGKSLRIGITGFPGAGKSSFIETFGLYLINLGYKVAVLAIDPSSTITKGSILGDKTRMEKLSREKNSFIRPSPSSGTLGGVARKTRETMLVCEAAGYDVILVETVGVGQSETTVRSMVDFFLLIMIAGAGDELQGIKKGVIELADAILINKADGDNKAKALLAKSEFGMALHYLIPATKGWKTSADVCSALTGEGIQEFWANVQKFKEATVSSGVFAERRNQQNIDWMLKMIDEKLLADFYNDKIIKNELVKVTEKVLNGSLLPTQASELLLKLFNS